MIFSSFAHLIITVSLAHLFPVDIGILQAHANETEVESGFVIDASMWVVSTHTFPQAADRSRAPQKRRPESLGVITESESVLVLDAATRTVLFQKQPTIQRAIGSITKLVTAMVFLDTRPDLAMPAQVGETDVRLGGAQHLVVGDSVRLEDLLFASLVASDNSATAALVRLSGFSHEQFVEAMNQKAKELKMEQTVFVDATGLSSQNRSTAQDIAQLLLRVGDIPLIKEATTTRRHETRSLTGRAYVFENTNELLEGLVDTPPYRLIGGKTGFLPEAGYCLGTIASQENGKELIVVVLGAPTKKGRFQDVKALIVWAYETFSWTL